MKIAHTGLNLPEGKVKYDDPIILALTNKVSPKKVTSYYFDFLPDDYESADIIVIARNRILDLLIQDIEKLENRRERISDADEKAMLDRILLEMEDEVPLCDKTLAESDREYLQKLSLLSLKPTLVIDGDTVDVKELIPRAMEKAGVMFFYTAAKQEVHAWLIRCGDDAQTCAGKIHTDLERGFIKAEIVTVDDMLQCHSLNDANERGLSRLVDRDFVIPANTVIDIRFNV